ncbi:YcnI family protein [Pseudonocardia sp. MH-G8]|uniref:YcnI family copper-binding membrane protein n=1 Tax=Pseudonocardia sp. MH-G8 TaxID=1854588 RepID=UPI000B9FA2AD|nr:YcnI family protein [Pseudonocardia sp. MH-G8]OZM76560.1 nuclear export factor GLE1 [Pseudonocardia sp. MH-G8]
MSSSVRRGALRAGTVLGTAAVVAVIGAAPAFAHVTANPDTAEQGSYSVISFRVPTESETAGTVKLEVTLPTDHPVTSVRTTPRPGWTATMARVPLDPPIESHGRTITEAVQTVIWTAEPGYRIGPGEFAEFPLSLGPLPTDTDRLVLPAVQTYDDGEVVAWDQPPTADGAEPERSAPVVMLTPPADDTSHAAAAGSATNATAANVGATDTTARWLGGGLLVGALGLGVGVGALLRSRRTRRAES